MLKKCSIVFLLGILCSCTHSVHVVHIDEVLSKSASKKGRVVSAEAEQQVVMGITDNTNYVNRAYVSLKEKCSGGQVYSILSRYSTSHGFFSWTNKIFMKGICIK